MEFFRSFTRWGRFSQKYDPLELNYAQVQGQMAIGERMWCDFVVFTFKGVSVQRIFFNRDYWTTRLLLKLVSFYDNCVALELVRPVSPLGLPIRNMSKS